MRQSNHHPLQEERRKRNQVDIDFAPEDIALATVPGADFDPRERAFDVDELRPQPIIRYLIIDRRIHGNNHKPYFYWGLF